MISQKVYGELKEKYGEISSWAVWNPDDVKSNTGDMTVFSETDLLDTLHSNFVLVGINESVHADRKDGFTGSWTNFHSDDESIQKDFILRAALKGTEFWGSYMTDAVKYHSDENSARVGKFIKENSDVLATNIKALKNELKILGDNPRLIAMGRMTEGWLRENLGDEYEIFYMRHYSNGASVKEVRDQALFYTSLDKELSGKLENKEELQEQFKKLSDKLKSELKDRYKNISFICDK